jgi:hypothetical protein
MHTENMTHTHTHTHTHTQCAYRYTGFTCPYPPARKTIVRWRSLDMFLNEPLHIDKYVCTYMYMYLYMYM